MTPDEIAAAFAHVLGRPVRYLDIPDWMMLKALRAMGLPDFQQAQVRYYVQDYRRNAFAIGAPSEAVRLVGGREPEDFETIAGRYANQRPRARRNLINWLRTMATCARIPLTPALNFDRLQQIQEQPSQR
jgi:NAD(P)H dehydrogenase (quinone)